MGLSSQSPDRTVAGDEPASAVALPGPISHRDDLTNSHELGLIPVRSARGKPLETNFQAFLIDVRLGELVEIRIDRQYDLGLALLGTVVDPAPIAGLEPKGRIHADTADGQGLEKRRFSRAVAAGKDVPAASTLRAG